MGRAFWATAPAADAPAAWLKRQASPLEHRPLAKNRQRMSCGRGFEVAAATSLGRLFGLRFRRAGIAVAAACAALRTSWSIDMGSTSPPRLDEPLRVRWTFTAAKRRAGGPSMESARGSRIRASMTFLKRWAVCTMDRLLSILCTTCGRRRARRRRLRGRRRAPQPEVRCQSRGGLSSYASLPGPGDPPNMYL